MNWNHEVMNCEDWVPSLLNPNSCISPKYDGVRGFWYPGQDILTSRDNKPLFGFDHIIEEFRMQDYKRRVDMELWIPGMEFNEISGLVRNHDPVPECLAAIIDSPGPEYLRDRLKLRPKDGEAIFRIPHYKCSTVSTVKKFHREFLDQKLEGSVIKTLGHKYRNSRSTDWMRWVPIKSEDCVVTGVYEGTKSFTGMLGGFLITFRGIENCKVGTLKGWTHEDRRQALLEPEKYIGRTMVVPYKNLQPSGKPRQPRFGGWRYDK